MSTDTLAELRGHDEDNLPPLERTIIAPEGGWKAHTLYRVLVAHNKSNPIHYAYFKVGFLNGKVVDGKPTPGGYSEVWENNYDHAAPIGRVHFMRPIKELHTDEDEE